MINLSGYKVQFVMNQNQILDIFNIRIRHQESIRIGSDLGNGSIPAVEDGLVGSSMTPRARSRD